MCDNKIYLLWTSVITDDRFCLQGVFSTQDRAEKAGERWMKHTVKRLRREETSVRGMNPFYKVDKHPVDSSALYTCVVRRTIEQWLDDEMEAMMAENKDAFLVWTSTEDVDHDVLLAVCDYQEQAERVGDKWLAQTVAELKAQGGNRLASNDPLYKIEKRPKNSVKLGNYVLKRGWQDSHG